MKSMTGFGRAETQIGTSHLIIEVKSVNHRYLDCRFRMPSFLNSIELTLTNLIRDKFHRGSFEIHIKHRLVESKDSKANSLIGTRFTIDEKAAKSLVEGLEKLSATHGTPKQPNLDLFLATNRVFIPIEEVSGLDEANTQIKEAFELALSALAKSRESEGTRIKKFLKAEVERMKETADKVRQLAPGQPERIREELIKRIESWKLTQPVDSQRLEAEIAFYSDKADFTEELDRLHCHAEAFEELLESGDRIGRRLDFYTQELHRELNTMSSKATLPDITRLVVSGKNSVEKLRQQVQNVE